MEEALGQMDFNLKGLHHQEVVLSRLVAMEEMGVEAAVVESSQRLLQMKWTDKLAVVAMEVEAAEVLAPELMIVLILSKVDLEVLAVAEEEEESTNLV